MRLEGPEAMFTAENIINSRDWKQPRKARKSMKSRGKSCKQVGAANWLGSGGQCTKCTPCRRKSKAATAEIVCSPAPSFSPRLGIFLVFLWASTGGFLRALLRVFHLPAVCHLSCCFCSSTTTTEMYPDFRPESSDNATRTQRHTHPHTGTYTHTHGADTKTKTETSARKFRSFKSPTLKTDFPAGIWNFLSPILQLSVFTGYISVF